MIRVGIRELKRRASELVRMVHETGKEVQVTYRGQVVALLVPAKRARKDDKNALTKLDQLATEIGARWPEDVSAAEAVSEGRQ
jgi:prevent-host-death family protein